MRKRIALFVIGFVLAIGTFWLYQYITGASFLSPRKQVAGAGGGDDNRESRPPTYEQRAPNGDLLYLLSAKKAAPLKDENGKPIAGQYELTEPMATYYTTDGNLLYIRADRGTITINDRTGAVKAGISDRFRGAHLSGNVVLTYGPRESFMDTSLEIKAGQFQVRFEKDLDLNYAEGIVTSPGLVHLRADQDKLRFDGENLTIAFNRSQKKQEIELLRIEPTSGKDNYMLFKDVGRQGFSLDDTATTRAGGGTGNAAGNVATQASVATTATAPAAATAPQIAKDSRPAPIVYKVSLGKEVAATLGGRKLTSDQLFVFFQSPANPASGKSAATAKAVEPAPAATATSGPATTTVATTPPAPKAAPDDLEVRWTGPMEMRPAAAGDVELSDRRDIAIEAVGTKERPVLVSDETRTARAGILQYHRAAQNVALAPGNVGPVVITDADLADPVRSLRTLTCQGVTFSRSENLVHLAGPGRMEVPQSVLRRNEKNVVGNPLVVAWENRLDVELADAAQVVGKGPKKMAIRRALFTGKSSITDVDFSLDSDLLDILVAPSPDAKTAQALEHLVATGNVHVKGANRANAGIEDADKPSGVNADRLELRTAIAGGGKMPVPSWLLAEGNVVAWAYQPEQGSKSKTLSKQTLYTPKLDVSLAPKARSSTTTASGGFANVNATSLLATDGVIVELEGFTSQTVFAKGKTLFADMKNGRDNTQVTLEGESLMDGTKETVEAAEVSQGERGDNKITGFRILLDQKNKSIDIPGAGTFDFVQPPQKAGQAPMPAQVTWTRSMHYDGKTLLAHFLGDIDAHRVGSTDQISKLTCNKMFDVQLATDAPPISASTSGPTKTTTKMHLAKIAARGNVNVQSTTLDPAGKVLTTIYLTKTDWLDYTEATKTLNIPGPGQLLLQDYRVEKADASSNNGHGDTVFTWDGGLNYTGPTGNIVFSKNVWMKHLPLKPFRMPGMAAKPAAGAAVENEPLVLTTDALTAKLDQSKATGGGDTSASPFAMSAGGTQKLESVLAAGHAVLTRGEDKLTADSLTFNALTHIVTANGKDDIAAEIFRPGEGILTADSLAWDLTKGKNAVDAKGIHGALQQN